MKFPLIFNSQILLLKCLTCHYFGGFSLLQLFTGQRCQNFIANGSVCKSGSSSSTSLFLVLLNFYLLYFCKICHLTLQSSTMILYLSNNQWNIITKRMGMNSIHQGWMFEWEQILHVDSSTVNIFILWRLLFPSATFVPTWYEMINSQITRVPIYKRPQSSQKYFCL